MSGGFHVELPTDVQVAATSALTPKQLETWMLELRGFSSERIAAIQGVSRRTVRGQLAAAHTKLYKAGVRQSSRGNYYVKEAA